MEWVLTIAIPFCALFGHCEPPGAIPLSPAEIRLGQRLDLLPCLPIAGASVAGPDAGTRFVMPCGDRAR